METIHGTLAEIRFHQNNFLIGCLSDRTAVKGSMSAPQVGLEYFFEGKWDESPRWGKTFVFDHYKRSYPKSNEGIRLYLEQNARWIGPEISKKIVAAFGEQSLDVLKNDPERVAKEISGITTSRAQEISEMLKRVQDNEDLEIALNELLEGLPISGRARHQIIQLWGADAPAKIRENPYELIQEIKGIGFLLADRIAKRVGFEMEGFPRIQAGVLHVLNEAAYGEGHTYLPQDQLIRKAQELLCVSETKITEMMPQIVNDGQIIVEDRRIFLPELYENEITVANHLKAIKEGR